MSGKRRESLIKTPKQLVTVLVLAFVVPIIVIVLLAQLATSGRNYDEDARSPEAIAKRIKPIAEVNLGAAGPDGKILKTGEEIYKTVCTACHATGIAKAPKFGDRRSYQMDPPNAREALREIALDIEEGADIVMVKPAMAYLDIIARARETFDVPLAAYQVSGEYAMIEAASRAGWIERERIILETTTAIKRAGADILITYYALELANML